MNENNQQCSGCGQWFEKEELCFIEDTSFCIKCMYGDAKPFEIYLNFLISPINLTRKENDRVFF